jgi:hypothetical protein
MDILLFKVLYGQAQLTIRWGDIWHLKWTESHCHMRKGMDAGKDKQLGTTVQLITLETEEDFL